MAFVTLEKQEHIGILTINRPEALNALNSQVLSDLETAIDQVKAITSRYYVIAAEGNQTIVNTLNRFIG